MSDNNNTNTDNGIVFIRRTTKISMILKRFLLQSKNYTLMVLLKAEKVFLSMS
jgi:hypothetical protein